MDYWIGVFTLTCIYLIAILGVSVLYGFTGLFTMGHAGFMSLGAYTSAIITIYFGVPNFVGIVAGVLVAALIGVLIGILTLRMSGDYFVIDAGHRRGNSHYYSEFNRYHRRSARAAGNPFR